MFVGAVTVAVPRWDLGVSTTSTTPPRGAGSARASSPMRPRMAKRSTKKATSRPESSTTRVSMPITRPAPVSETPVAWDAAVSCPSSSSTGTRRCSLWSRWTARNRPSTTGYPLSFAAPIAP